MRNFYKYLMQKKVKSFNKVPADKPKEVALGNIIRSTDKLKNKGGFNRTLKRAYPTLIKKNQL